MNEEEERLLKKFEQGDKEIDEMLKVVIQQIDKLHLYAEGITGELDIQQKLIKKQRAKIEKSWVVLSKKDSDLKKTLFNYRKGGNMCTDIILVCIIAVLVCLNLKVYSEKGYI